MQPDDHDLLVEIHTTVKQIGVSVGNHERRIRLLERYVWMALGAILLVETVIHAALK